MQSFLTLFLTQFQEIIIKKTKLTKGLTNNVYLLECLNNKYIYKELKEHISDIEVSVMHHVKNPKIYMYDNKHIIQEYIPPEEIHIKRDSYLIAAAIKKFHKIKINIKFTFLDDINQKIKILDNKQLENNILKNLSFINLKCNTLCHNDIHKDNLIKHNNNIYIIDFETCSLNEPAYDIANFFCESEILYSESFAEGEKIKFIKSYLSTADDILAYKYLERINEVTLYAHLYWFLWGVQKVNSNDKTSSFNYKAYTYKRFIKLCEKNIISFDAVENIKNLYFLLEQRINYVLDNRYL